jgi:hypothetical protein
MSMGYDISASSSQSASSGNKISTGPVQFAPVTVNQGGDKLTLWLIVGAIAAVFLFFLSRK